jgi:hypothetical protein
MAISKKHFDIYIKDFDFYKLFNELGWDNDLTELSVPFKDNPIIYKLKAVANKSNFKIFICDVTEYGLMPDYKTRKAILNYVKKMHLYHLIIFFDKNNKKQIWQYTIREADKPDKVVYFEYNNEDSQKIYTKLRGLFFDIDEEENITIIDVTNRFYENFNKNYEKVTKQFYDKFKKEHAAFISFIIGIDDDFYKTWYASLMLNRLMFCYFIQKKGFLDNNFNYLKDKLDYCKSNVGNDKFYSFYKKFLLVLFHEGLGSNTRNEELKKVLGNIPYLNGGLFDEHEIEKTFTDLDIKDEAFERIFAFFDQYDWHLDTRPNTNGREINPDVIGYIFEKYINDRAEMGAYYTKEDITEYISKNCIIPFLFEKTKIACPSAFRAEGEIWQMLKESEDRYIYDAVKKGVNLPLPDEIAIGINPELENKLVTLDEPPKLLELRKDWNKPTPEEYALPTEIWRETIDRRNRYFEILQKIKNGEITDINDFITYNLNIRQFAQDVIENSNDHELIRELYKCIYQITVLDPTCGSGAFLFAALNVLEPLYEALIFRMKGFVDEAKKGKHVLFEGVLHNVNNQPNLKYFIYKSIIINNLYGVDIMKEATEIAKLRLFLKLVSVIDKDNTKTNMGLVPLPDIDFNIRSGNTLIGFINIDEIKDFITHNISFEYKFDDINNMCQFIADGFCIFKEKQSTEFFKEQREVKEKLSAQLKDLSEKLNKILYLSKYATWNYTDWLKAHKPFHWFAEFYEIINIRAGFDIIIGNPPYVEHSSIKKKYSLQRFELIKCGNLYAFVIEQILKIANQFGKWSVIVPASTFTTERMLPLKQKIINSHQVFVSFYGNRPATLFSGAQQNLCIVICENKKKSECFTTQHRRWSSEERDVLFQTITYTKNSARQGNLFFKFGDYNEYNILNKMKKFNTASFYNLSFGNYKVYISNAAGYWLHGIRSNQKDEKFRDKEVILKNRITQTLFCSIINSSSFFWFWQAISDTYHVNSREYNSISLPINDNIEMLENELLKLENDLLKNMVLKTTKEKTGLSEQEEFYPKKSKKIIDNIEYILANYWGLNERELDFVINYYLKYRLGKEIE